MLLVVVVFGDAFPQVPSEDSADGSALPLIARLCDAESGRIMEVFGSQPAAQVYTSNFLSDGEVSFLLLSASRWLVVFNNNFTPPTDHDLDTHLVPHLPL